jgi:hypothetical protein
MCPVCITTASADCRQRQLGAKPIGVDGPVSLSERRSHSGPLLRRFRVQLLPGHFIWRENLLSSFLLGGFLIA